MTRYIHIMQDDVATYTNEFTSEFKALEWLAENWNYTDYLCTVTLDKDYKAENWENKLEAHRREQNGK